MKLVLTWPIGRHAPGDTVDVDPRFGAVLTREGFARLPDGDGPPPAPQGPTVAELYGYATDHGLSMSEAKAAMAADIHARRTGAPPC